MKLLLAAILVLTSSSAFAANCVSNGRGRAACETAGGAVVVAPRAGVATTQNGYGGKAAYNPNTGNAAVSHRNANGVATTQTSRGGEAKTKNGMGVAQGPGGKTCVKGRGEARCN